MNKTIFVTRQIPDTGIHMLKEKGYEVDINPDDVILTQAQLVESLQKKPYDAVLSLLTDHIDATVYDAAPSVKLYANYATGYDNVDVALAEKRGITVANAPAPFTSEAVAEHTLALMLALAARIVEADESVRRGQYNGWAPMHFIGTDVLGKTLGLIGAGRIGERVAHYAKGLGLSIIYTDVVRNERIEADCGAIYKGTADEVLREADIVSLHVPLLDSTKHLINAERLALMKPIALLINTSRGPVIDEAALVAALTTKRIAGAGLDVFEFEPSLSPGLVELQNVILTPHIASASIAARDQMAEITAQNIIDFFEGRIPKYAVHA